MELKEFKSVLNKADNIMDDGIEITFKTGRYQSFDIVLTDTIFIYCNAIKVVKETGMIKLYYDSHIITFLYAKEIQSVKINQY